MVTSICTTMHSTAVCVVLAIVLVVTQCAIRIGTITRDNVCIGGSLVVTSEPNKLLVNNDKCSATYKKEEWQLEPDVKYGEAEIGSVYTLLMIDPNAPNHNDGEYYLHWIMSNINGKDFANGNVRQADVIAPYKGPAPPKGTGFHRYQFLVYLQEDPKARIVVNKIPDEKRRKFNLENWLKEQSATTKLVGPLSGVQFRADFGGTPLSD